jgi:hypothetical protein
VAKVSEINNPSLTWEIVAALITIVLLGVGWVVASRFKDTNVLA